MAVILSAWFCCISMWTSCNLIDETIHVQPKWKQGDTAHYEWIKAKYRIKDGQRSKLGESRTELSIEVLRADANGYEIGWQFGESVVDIPGKVDKSAQGPFQDPFKDLRMVITLEKNGDFARLKNWEEVKKRGDQLINNLRGMLAGSTNRTGADTAIAQTQALFSTQAIFEALGCRDQKLFLMINGVIVSSNNPLEYPDFILNPMGGPPFPCLARYAFKSLDKDKHLASVEWTLRFKEMEAQSAMEKTWEAMAKQLGHPVTEAEKAKLKDLSIKDDALFEINTETGWLRSFTHKRTTKMQGIVQEEETKVRKK